MKKISLLFIAIMALAMSASAQLKSNLVFFAEEGEKFFVIMDGIRQNDVAQTNVRITDVMGTFAKFKVVFEDETLGEINDTKNWNEGTETSYNIREKKTGAANSLKKAGDWAAKDLGAKDDTVAYVPVEEKYVIKWFKEIPIAQAAPVVANDPTVVVYHTQPNQTTTTVITQGDPGYSENVSVNMSVGGSGTNGSVGMDIRYTETQTSQTTVIGEQQTVIHEDHYMMPGYSGPIGCPWPMSDGDFQSAKSSVASKTWDESRLTMAEQILSSNCMTSAQVRDMMNTFEWEETKLDFAKFAYGHTYDKGNFYKVNDAFEWEQSITDLNTYMQSH